MRLPPVAPPTSPLTYKQRQFIAEFAVDWNATQAAIRAGYSARTAHVQGPRLLGNVRVAAAIQQGQAARLARTGITADAVLNQLRCVAFSDIRQLFNANGDLKLPTELDDDTAAAVAAIKVSVKGVGDCRVETMKETRFVDKIAALGMLMKHLGLLKDRVGMEFGGADGEPIDVTLNLGGPPHPPQQ